MFRTPPARPFPLTILCAMALAVAAAPATPISALAPLALAASGALDVGESTEADLGAWTLLGQGERTVEDGETHLAETPDSKGVMLVSPEPFGPHAVLAFDVLPANADSVLVAILHLADPGDPATLTVPPGYDGGAAWIQQQQQNYFFAFHNAAHDRTPFVHRFSPQDAHSGLLDELGRNVMADGVWSRIEAGCLDGTLYLRVNGETVVLARDLDPLQGGHLALRIRGTQTGLAACRFRNIVVRNPSPCEALDHLESRHRGAVPEGFLLRLTAPGADYRTHPDADDQGPPEEVKRCMLGATGNNVSGIRLNWAACEPDAPDPAGKRTFRIHGPLRRDLARVPDGHFLINAFDLDSANTWQSRLKAEDPAAWWALAEGFMTAAAHALRMERPEPETIFYHAPGNEPSLTGRPDWAERHLEPVPHWHRALKAADARNLLIVGALVVGRRGHIEALYRAGLKGHFDVLDIHSYDDTGGKAHLSMDQILESRQVLVDHGDGDKTLWLGEGWAPFPLPEHIDRREHLRHQEGLGMSTEPYRYSETDIAHYRKSVFRGWYNLMTPRADYDPSWVRGASYFCLNDMWGSVGWKKRAIPHHDAQGNIEWWDLDGYRIPYQPFALEPVYRPWGIINAHGWPKGDIVANFPPYLPKHTFTAVADAPQTDGVYDVLAGQACRVTLTFTSEEDAPYGNGRFGMDTRESNRNRNVQFRALGDPASGDILPGQTVTREFEFTCPPELSGRTLCLVGELDYTWDGDIPAYASAWLNVRVSAPARQHVAQSGAVVAGRDAAVNVTVTLVNETASLFSTRVIPRAGSGIVFDPAEYLINLHKGETQDVTFSVRLAAGAPLGSYSYTIDTGSSLTSPTGEITFALPAADPSTHPWGLLHNGGFEEAAGDRGHANWSGDMTDWDSGDALDSLPDSGARCLTYAANGVSPTKRIAQTVSWPAPGAASGPLTATAWALGNGFEESAAPSESTFQFHLAYWDAQGKELARHSSDVFKGTGAWERLEHVFPEPPAATRFVKFEIESAISRGNGWHLHHLDNVRLTP